MSIYTYKSSFNRSVALASVLLFLSNSIVFAEPDLLSPQRGYQPTFQAMRLMMEERVAPHQGQRPLSKPKTTDGIWWNENQRNRGVMDAYYSMTNDKHDLVGNLAGFESLAPFLHNQGANYLITLPPGMKHPNDPCPFCNIGFNTTDSIAFLSMTEIVGKDHIERFTDNFIEFVSEFVSQGRPMPEYFNNNFLERLDAIKAANVGRSGYVKEAVKDRLRSDFAKARSVDNIIDWPLAGAFQEYCLRQVFYGNGIYDALIKGGGESFSSYVAKYMPWLREMNQGKGEKIVGRFREFCERNKVWVKGYGLDEYALFHSLLNKHGRRSWTEWEEKLKNPNDPENKAAIESAKKECENDILFYKFLQWMCFERYQKAKAEYRKLGIKTVGNLECYPSRDSATTWALQHLYDTTKENGAPAEPVDPKGQAWGSPVANWDQYQEELIQLWEARIRWMAQFDDGFEIDHVLGLIQEFVMRAGEKPANGWWSPPDDNPGREKALARGRYILKRLLDLSKKLGIVAIAEDLGDRPDARIKEMLVELSLEYPNFVLLNPLGWRSMDVDRRGGNGRLPKTMLSTQTHDMMPPIRRLSGDASIERPDELNSDGSRKNLLDWAESLGVELPGARRDRKIDGKDFAGVAAAIYQAVINYAHSYSFPITTLLGKEHVNWNVPGKSWKDLPTNWSNRHAPGSELAKLPDLGYFPDSAKEIESLVKDHASNAGLVIPRAEDTRYSLLVDDKLCTKEELDADNAGIETPEGVRIGAANRFNLEKADTANVDNILAHVKDSARTIVQISGEMSQNDIERLKRSAPGIRVIRVDSSQLRYDKGLSDTERALCRFDLYNTMLLARRLTAEDLKEKNSIYTTLKFMIRSHLNSVDSELTEKYLEAIVADGIENVIFIIKQNLSYKPVGRWNVPQYHLVTAAVISA